MTDHATPNLPAISFDATEAFYTKLGFETRFKNTGWMILSRGSIQLEFFPHPELNPLESWFSCCIHLDDLNGFVAECEAAGIPMGNDKGQPRITPPRTEPSGLSIAYLVDENGSLIRLIQNSS